jgi:hypothetical protein
MHSRLADFQVAGLNGLVSLENCDRSVADDEVGDGCLSQS